MKRFSIKKILSQHSVIHLNLRPYACDICDKSFKLWISLASHRKTARHLQRERFRNLQTADKLNDYDARVEAIKLEDIKEEIKREESVEAPDNKKDMKREGCILEPDIKEEIKWEQWRAQDLF